MKKGLILDLPLSEYQQRLNQLIQQMDKENLVAVIFTSDENTYYFSGFRSIVWASKVSTPGVLVITKNSDMAICTSKSGRATAKATSCVEDIRYYGQDSKYQTYAQSIASVLKEGGIKKGRIGFEIGSGNKMHLHHKDREALFSKLKDFEIADASDSVWKVRGVKSVLEIERIRKCCEINIKGIEKGFDSVVEGMTELEVYRNILQEYFRLGAEHTLPLGLRAGKERYSQSNCPPSDRPIGRGDIILVDGGPLYKGYYSDIIRQAVIGRPTDYQLEMFNVARDACYVGIGAVEPGKSIKEVCKAVDDFMANSKFAEIYSGKNWCGHSIGVGVHEFPMLDIHTDIPLEPGMVFAIEPSLYKEGIGSLGIEENILVTKNGCEILTPSNSELKIL